MRRAAFVVLLLVQVVAGVISISVWFVEQAEAFERDANVLLSTFGVGMAIFGTALTLPAFRGQRWA